MTDCSFVDSLVTPYVDDDISASDREAVERHLHACRACHGRVLAEQAVRALLSARRRALEADAAPPALRARCQAMLAGSEPEHSRPAAVPPTVSQRLQPASRQPAPVRSRLVPF